MRALKSLSIAAALAFTLLGAAGAPAFADIQGADRFRVVGLTGTQTLKLMNGPARWAGVEVEVPFDARDLRATGVRQGNWIQLSYRADNGYDFTGWADGQYLAADQYGQPTVFRIVNVRRGQSISLMSRDGYGVRAYIPAATSVLPSCGPCQDGYCQVRYHTRKGDLEGLVGQAYLAVARPADPGFPVADDNQDEAQPAYADTNVGNGYQPPTAPYQPDYANRLDDLPSAYLPLPRHHAFWR